MFSCEFWGISKNTFFHRTHPVAASDCALLNLVREFTKTKPCLPLTIFLCLHNELSCLHSTIEYRCLNKIRSYHDNSLNNMIHKSLIKCQLSSCPEVFCKKDVFQKFVKFAGKYLCQSLSFNKVAGLWRRCFSLNFTKFLRAPIFIEHLWWLFLPTDRNWTAASFNDF